MQAFALQAMNQKINIEREALVTICEYYKEKVQYFLNDIIQENKCVAPLEKLIEKYDAQPGGSCYMALFIIYCLAHTEEELKNKTNDFKSFDYAETLLNVAQEIRAFKDNNSQNNALNLRGIPGINAVLENLLNVLQPLTSKKITHLDLADNELSKIPANISTLKYLKELDLSNNNLTELPQSISDLEHLVFLHIHDNSIKKISKKLKKKGLYILDAPEDTFFGDNHRCSIS